MSRSDSAQARQDWFKRSLPEGIPQLWCPPLTHYDAEGNLDAQRIEAHWRFLAPWVKGLLVPGSTGDGWELTTAEANQVLDLAVSLASRFKLRVLVGALRPKAEDAQEFIRNVVDRLKAKGSSELTTACLAEQRVCGFAVCPPRGAQLTTGDMDDALSRILGLGWPLALYQLPQVTQNEMSPALVSSLAERFPNFLLFKDTSGGDAVAKSGANVHGVFLVRGMEGGYDQWLKAAGGPYDGFLLSAANAFAPQLHQLIQQVQAGQKREAGELSRRISAVIEGVFTLVGSLPDGNAFANGGKAMDHFMAHGPDAVGHPPPRLHSGRSLSLEVIRGTGELLTRYGLMPERGYLE